MPQNLHAAAPPVVLTVESASRRGAPLACVQPGFYLAQELIYSTRERDKLLILGGVVAGFHLHATTRPRPD